MPQTLQVLLCVVCKTFQVQIVKKSSNKWNCKICDSKQSVQQVYAKGTGAECRKIVQALNEARGIREESQSIKTLASAVAQAEATEQETHLYFADDTNFNEESQYDHHYAEENEFLQASQFSTAATLHNSHKPEIASVPTQESKWAVFLDN